MAIKKHIRREIIASVWIMPPYILVLNLLMFGTCIFHSMAVFSKSFFYSGLYLFVAYFAFRTVAMFIRMRIPAAGDLFKRIAIMLPVFYVMNNVMLSGILSIYEKVNLLNCAVKPDMLWWAIVYACITSTALTFINEGVANWGEWKASLSETEKLRNAYRRSKLLGLKGQINPHFLFNCFNTLSGLIQEDEAKAEKFLDEMTKVHRYLLRSDDELLVTIAEEIKFARSYLYLAKERFGSAIDAAINLDNGAMQKFIPPLSMQVILKILFIPIHWIKKSPYIVRFILTRKMNYVLSIHCRKNNQAKSECG